MSRGKRYDGEQKLNVKKVFAVLIAIAVIVMFVIGIRELLNTEDTPQEKVVALRYFPVYTDGKWGVIDSRGNIIIEPTYDEYIVIPDNQKPIFICTINVNYADNTYDTKVLNENSEEQLMVRRGLTNTINIKFNKMYNPERELRGVIFSNVVLNYEDYISGTSEKNSITIKLEF